jgi:hypothetical protein
MSSFRVPTTCTGLTWTSISPWSPSNTQRSTLWSVKCSLDACSGRRFVGHQRSARAAAAETPQASFPENNGQRIFIERSDALSGVCFSANAMLDEGSDGGMKASCASYSGEADLQLVKRRVAKMSPKLGSNAEDSRR